MPLSMSTLACPKWNLPTMCARARAYGYDGIDFRGLGEALDVTATREFTADVAATARLLADHGLMVSGTGSGIALCDADRTVQTLDEARRTIDAAMAVGARHVRVFGGGRPDVANREATVAVGVACISAILDLPDARRLSWNLDTHGEWTRSADCRGLIDAVGDPAFGIAWNVCHTTLAAGESIAQTLDALGDTLRYVHAKDVVPTSDGFRYVLPGDGDIGLRQVYAGLKRRGYDGWLMFEHERRWHPELEPPDVALPAFVRWARGMADASKDPSPR